MTASGEVPTGTASQHSVLNSTFPVLLPKDNALFMAEADFQAFIITTLVVTHGATNDTTEEESLKNPASSTTVQATPKPLFIAGLEKHDAHHRSIADLAAENLTLTENADVTNISSKNALVDLFYDLGENTQGHKLKTLLEAAWAEDPSLSLKIIFNARSIHLGKSNKIACYKAFGWLAENHPRTLLANLPWLVRPIIAKQAEKPEEKSTNNDDDFEMITTEEVNPFKAHDVRHGVSHGYWKDLLNLVVFAAHNELKFDGDPASLLNQHPDNSKNGKRKREWDPKTAKETRHAKRKEQHASVNKKMEQDPFYRALHLTVARLFAIQLREDKVLLDSDKKSDLGKLSLAAKWSPTFGEFHDKNTFILSSIAEALFPDSDGVDREQYLRHAREFVRKQYTSPLRKALSVVEREIAANKFEDIKYNRVPSLAMDRYTGLFMKKDYDHFAEYVKAVSEGTEKISGATLLPSTLVNKARNIAGSIGRRSKPTDLKTAKVAVEAKMHGDVIDGQWNTLVQRVRDAGTLQSSIAVCDVSGSMGAPVFRDKSCPMDSAIGLALLISEVTAQPFGGGFISFHETPTYLSVGGEQDMRGLVEQVRYMIGTEWGGSTDFVAVFESVILPMAIRNKIKPEDMVKQVFVFSDMQFNQANGYYASGNRWTSSYDRIKQKYAAAGYEMPRMIFWNLAADSTSKPTTIDDMDIALVSGYSQGMLKAFLETGTFDDEEEVVEDEAGGDEDGEFSMIGVCKVKKKIEPIIVVKKAVNHKAYSMLQVVD